MKEAGGITGNGREKKTERHIASLSHFLGVLASPHLVQPGQTMPDPALPSLARPRPTGLDGFEPSVSGPPITKSDLLATDIQDFC